MSINFPNSPSNGQQITSSGKTYTYNSSKAAWKANLAGGFDSGQVVNILNQNAIDSAVVNSVVSNSSEILDSSQVVSLISTNSNKVYTVANLTALGALTGMATGDQALVTSTNKLFMYNSTGWYLIATITNGAPSAISNVDSAYAFASGSPIIVNAIATDPEGLPLTWSSTTSGLGDIATIAQGTGDSSNYFTVTPSTNDSDAGTFTLTIAATDNVNGAVNFPASFTLSFVADWTTTAQQQKLTASDAGSNDTNGSAVDIKGDRAITSAPGEKAAYVWKRSATTWSQEAKLDRSSDGGQLYGAVAMSTDNNYVILGSPAYGGSSKGAGIVYVRSGTSWTFQAALVPSDVAANDEAGLSVSISSDGTYATVGAEGENSGQGAAYVFIRSGTSWTQQQKITEPTRENTARFGAAAKLNDAGDVLMCSSPLSDEAVGNAGAAFIFTRSGTTWSYSTYVAGSDAGGSDYAGGTGSGANQQNASDINADGDLIVLGAYGHNTGGVGNSGAAYIFKKGSTHYDIAGATFTAAEYVHANFTNCTAITFNGDGTKIFAAGGGYDRIASYTLTTAYDISTASYDSNPLVTSSYEGNPNGLQFNADGTKLFFCGSAANRIFVYNLTTGYDLSTASIGNSGNGVSFASQDTNTRDMKFKPDGTVLYVVGQQYDKVYQYSLSTAFDITTISYASKSFSVTSQESTPEGIDFTPDGTKMFIIGEQYNDVFQYNLSTAWDVSTASYANISYDLGSRQAQSSAVIFNPNGTKMFTAGRSADNINEFDTSAKSYSQVTKLTPPSNVLNQDFGETVAISGNTVAIGFQSAGGGGANAVSLVYDTSDESTWTLRKTFAGSDVAANYAYGFSIAIDETNKSIIVGSPGVINQTPSPGAAYVFTAS